MKIKIAMKTELSGEQELDSVTIEAEDDQDDEAISPAVIRFAKTITWHAGDILTVEALEDD